MPQVPKCKESPLHISMQEKPLPKAAMAFCVTQSLQHKNGRPGSSRGTNGVLLGPELTISTRRIQ